MRVIEARRLVGAERWMARVLLTETGAAIGYTGLFGVRRNSTPHVRVALGYAMGCVKQEDTDLLPFGYLGYNTL